MFLSQVRILYKLGWAIYKAVKRQRDLNRCSSLAGGCKLGTLLPIYILYVHKHNTYLCCIIIWALAVFYRCPNIGLTSLSRTAWMAVVSLQWHHSDIWFIFAPCGGQCHAMSVYHGRHCIGLNKQIYGCTVKTCSQSLRIWNNNNNMGIL